MFNREKCSDLDLEISYKEGCNEGIEICCINAWYELIGNHTEWKKRLICCTKWRTVVTS